MIIVFSLRKKRKICKWRKACRKLRRGIRGGLESRNLNDDICVCVCVCMLKYQGNSIIFYIKIISILYTNYSKHILDSLEKDTNFPIFLLAYSFQNTLCSRSITQHTYSQNITVTSHSVLHLNPRQTHCLFNLPADAGPCDCRIFCEELWALF